MTRRMPGQTCVLCERSLEETGGVRLIWAGSFGVSLCTIQNSLREIRHPARTIRLAENHRDVVVVLFGNWKDNAIERARQVAQSGFRPWFCQRCVHKAICLKCDRPMRPAAVDMLNDAGRTSHVAVFAGMASKCRNPECDDFASEL